MRRSRKTDWMRRLVRENSLSSNDFILPIFVTEGKNKKIPIKTMPEVFRYSVDKLGHIVDRALKLKIPMVAIFPQTNSGLKDSYGSEALNENNLVCKAIRKIKDKYRNEIGIMTDVALDPYTSHGHDGILRNKKDLLLALNEISSIKRKNLDEFDLIDKRLMNLKSLTYLITKSALLREESRGAHISEDFSSQSNKWLKHINWKLTNGTLRFSYSKQ